MKDKCYYGRVTNFFFYLLEMIVANIAVFSSQRCSLQGKMSVLLYAALTLLVMRLEMMKVKESYRQWRLLQFLFFVLTACMMCCIFQNQHMFFLLLCIPLFINVLFLDVTLYKQQCVLIVVATFLEWFFPTKTQCMTVFELFYGMTILFLISWIACNIIGRFEFQNRRNFEQEQSLDDMLKVVEVKRDEALAATKSKSDFLSNMSHEIRTPINAVLGMNEMILRESEDENILEYASNIDRAGKLLLSLINDILDFSKIESGKMDIIPVNYQLSSVIHDLSNMLLPKAEEKGLELIVDVNSGIPEYLFGDEIRIRQVVTNILTNAVKYTEKGSVRLYVDFQKRKSDEILLIFEIQDTGKGIKKEDREKLFQSFQRLEEKSNRTIEGTGLGLSIVNRLVDMMDGRIAVDSKYGKGSKFTVWIPQKIEKDGVIGDMKTRIQTEKNERAKYQVKFHAPAARVLVVDDNQMNLAVFAGLLKKTKIQIDQAKSGMECLALLRKNTYDLLFLDHMMPKMDGMETMQKIREEKIADRMPIVALTANAVSGIREQYLKAGFSDYLSKPIVGSSLEKMLIQWLPKDKVHILSEEDSKNAGEKTNIDTKVEKKAEKKWLQKEIAEEYTGGMEELYQEMLKAYVEQSDTYVDTMKKTVQEEKWKDYQVVVHAIKSTSMSIGAAELSEQAKEMEMAAKEGNHSLIKENYQSVIANYQAVVDEAKGLIMDENAK